MMEGMKRILSEKGELIEKEIEKAISRKGTPNLHDAVWYHMGSGGKRVRPVLAIMTCEALGGNVDNVLPFAASCELLHNWLLVHDDIEDGDRVRRSKPAVWVKYGLGHGINIGDFMSEKVYELILASNLDAGMKLRLISEVVETSVKTAEGQALEMNMRENDSPSESDYMEMITNKTAWYLTLPMIGGAVIAGKPGLVDSIKEFGMKIGPAFQMIDDILDLTKGKGRGETGSDIREGKRSIMVVHCSSKCKPDEKKKLFGILGESREKTSKEDVEYVKKLFGKYGSLDYAKSRARSLLAESSKISSGMPENLRKILDQFAEYLVERKC